MLFLLFGNPLQAQFPGCGADDMQKQIEQQQPSIRQMNQLFERNWQAHQRSNQITSRQVYTIPVVVHLIHNNGPENLSDPQVQQAIDALNDGMRNRGAFNPQKGVDTEIEFCLAVRNPQGNPTTGITRNQSTLTQLLMEPQDTLMKDLIRWDPTQYLNIWIVNSITSQASGPGVAGYAYFPSSHGNREDGIVGEYTYFTSRQGDISVFVHEAGHYLGLYHTFSGGCTNSDCLLNGDRVCDTPPDGSTSSVACNASPNTCQTDEDDTSLQNPFRAQALGGMGDQPDMINNYMDYGDPVCTDAFTQGQKDRMVLALTTIRASLLQSLGCMSPCNTPVTAAFRMVNLPASVGTTLQLQSTSSSNVSTYDYEVNGQPLAQTANAQYTFTQKGIYIFSLRVTGPSANCFDMYRDTIEVFCEPRAQINGWQAYLLPGDTMALNAGNGGTFTWLVNGIIVGSSATFNYSSAQTGSVIIQLIVDNGHCKDTTMRVVQTGNCGVDDGAQKTYWALEDSLIMDFTLTPPIIRKEGSMLGFRFAGGPFLEHSVTISDEQENLLFYSNGQTVWDRNHQVMPNGSGILGHFSTDQGSIAFPDPDNPDIYYLFTLDAFENNYTNGLRYTKIDMRLRGGLGDVIPSQKNQFVMLTDTEHMHAVYHANGKDVWVVVGRDHRNGWTILRGDIVSILITAAGVQAPPIVTPIMLNGQTQNSGALRFSHNGQWLTRTNLLYQFNRQTGVPQLFMDFNPSIGVRGGVEFSPDDSKIYLTGIITGTVNNEIHQYDLSLGSPANILASKTLLYSNTATLFLGKMEMGKDKKLYGVTPRTAGLHVIHDPNLAGTACNFQAYGILYPNNSSSKSHNLPQYIRGKISTQSLALQTNKPNPCPGEQVKVWPKSLLGTYQLTFKVQGDATFQQVGDTLYLQPQEAGSVHVIAQFLNACETKEDTLYLQVKAGPLFDLGSDQVLCKPPVMVSVSFFPDVKYLWSDMQIGSQASFSQSGLYWLTATDSLSGCSYRDSISINPAPPAIPPDLGLDQLICEGGVYELKLTQHYPVIRWWDGSNQMTNTVHGSGKYWVDVEDICGNTFSDSINISLQQPNNRQMPDSAFFCPNEDIRIDMRSLSFTTYKWHDGIQGGIRTFSQAGIYYLSAWDTHNCVVYDTLVVHALPEYGPLNLPPSLTICNHDSLQVDVTTTGWIFYQWADGFTGAARSLNQAGTYHITATDANGCTDQASFQVHINTARPIPLQPEHSICLGDTLVTQLNGYGFSNFQWSDSSQSAVRKIWKPGIFGVKAIDSQGCLSIASTTIIVENCPYDVYMPNAFSPNGDAHNEWFSVTYRSDIVSYHLMIFNRWGQQIYNSKNPSIGWDGTYKGQSSPEGVYVYLLNFVAADGLSHQKKGTVTLLR